MKSLLPPRVRFVFATLGLSAALTSAFATTVIVAVGAPGDPKFAEDFTSAAKQWCNAAAKRGAAAQMIGLEEPEDKPDREQLKDALDQIEKGGSEELWLVLIGHGTFDGREARFNLRGPDVTASELAEWMKPLTRPTAVIVASSSSAPFLARLAATNRVVVTATKSGYQQNYSRFARFISEGIASLSADLDKDGQVSLLEAFLFGSRRVDEFYREEGRLVTEHALIDDNGDGQGTPAEWFRGIRAVKKAEGAEVDGFRAHQLHLVLGEEEQQLAPDIRARRNELEVKVEELRRLKNSMRAEAYYQELERLMLELARLYAEVEKNATAKSAEDGQPPAPESSAASTSSEAELSH